MSENPEHYDPMDESPVTLSSERKQRALGLDASITRRDFVGSTLLGTGAALLGMAPPGQIRTAAAQMTGLTMTGLGPDWTGPGGVGDYARSNGNTWDVVNRAHGGIRNQEFDKALASASDTGERHDLVVVGCGLSGLTAGFTFNKERPSARVLLLDQHPIFGGEAKQNEFDVDGYHLTAPQGSTGITVPFSIRKKFGTYPQLAKDLGFPDEFEFQRPSGMTKDILIPHDPWLPMQLNWDQSDIGYFYDRVGWRKNVYRNGFRDAPMSQEARQAMISLLLSRNPPDREDWRQWLDGMTYEQYLADVMGFRDDSLREVVRYTNPVMAANGCGLGADVVSAYGAYSYSQLGLRGYARYEAAGAVSDNAFYLATFPGGNSGIARLLVKKLIPDAFEGDYSLAHVLNNRLQWDKLDRPNQAIRMRLSSTVLAVQHDGHPDSAKGAIVIYEMGGALHKVHAKAVICAGQQHVNRHICRDISSVYREAMDSFHHAPMLTVNVALRNWKFLEKLGVASARWFDGFGWWMSLRRNLEIPGQTTMPLDPSKPYVFSLFNPFPVPGTPFPQQCTVARLQLFGMSYQSIELGVREQFTKLFGDYGFDARRDIAGIVANRWGHAFVVPPPGFFFGKNGRPASRDVLRHRYNRIAFCHCELTGVQNWVTAADEGTRAAQQVLEVL